jgi:hypothetical protein
MTAAQLADKLLSDEHADVLRESVAWMAARLMDAEVADRIEFAGCHPEQVAGWTPHQPVVGGRASGGQRAAQSPDLTLDAATGALGRRRSPQDRDQPLGRDHPVAMQEQQGQQPALQRSTDREMLAECPDLDGS